VEGERIAGAERTAGARMVGDERTAGVERKDGDEPIRGVDRIAGDGVDVIRGVDRVADDGVDVNRGVDRVAGDGVDVIRGVDRIAGAGERIVGDDDHDGVDVIRGVDRIAGDGDDGRAETVGVERGPTIAEGERNDSGRGAALYGGRGELLGEARSADDAALGSLSAGPERTAGSRAAESASRGMDAAVAGCRTSAFDGAVAAGATERQCAGGAAPAATAVRGTANACARAMP